MIKENPNNKSAQALKKCVEVIQTQTKSLLKREPDLVSKMNLLVKNTAEDIRRVRLQEGSTDIFADEQTKTVFEERDACKKKFVTYLQRARLILKLKQDMLDIYKKLESELITVDHMLEQYSLVLNNLKTSMSFLIEPEIIRRREFDQLNSELVKLYYDWVNKETESREKFFERGELDQLPYAFKKILINFMHDDDIKLVAPSSDQFSSISFADLKVKLAQYFSTWTKSPEQPLRELMSEVYIAKTDLEKQLEEKSKLVIMLEEDLNITRGSMVSEKKENSVLKSKCKELETHQEELHRQMAWSTEKLDSFSKENQLLQKLIDEYRKTQEEMQQQLTMSCTDMSRIEADVKVKECQILEFQANLVSLQSKLSISEKAAESAASHYKGTVEKLSLELAHEREMLEATKSDKEKLIRDLKSSRSHQLECEEEMAQMRERMSILMSKSANTEELLKKEIEELKLKVEEKDKRLHECETHLHETKMNFKKLQEQQIQAIKTKTQELVDKNLSEKREFEAKITSLESYKQLYEQLQREYEETKCNFSLTQSTVLEQETNLKTVMDKISEYESKLNTANFDKQNNDSSLEDRIKKLELDIADKNLIIETIEKDKEYLKDVESQNETLKKQMKTQIENYEAKIKSMQALLSEDQKASSTRLVETAKGKLESKLKEDFDKFYQSILKKVENLEVKGQKTEESVKNILRNNQMGILLKYMNK